MSRAQIVWGDDDSLCVCVNPSNLLLVKSIVVCVDRQWSKYDKSQKLIYCVAFTPSNGIVLIFVCSFITSIGNGREFSISFVCNFRFQVKLGPTNESKTASTASHSSILRKLQCNCDSICRYICLSGTQSSPKSQFISENDFDCILKQNKQHNLLRHGELMSHSSTFGFVHNRNEISFVFNEFIRICMNPCISGVMSDHMLCVSECI